MEPLSIPQILWQTLRIPSKSPKLCAALVIAYLATTALLYTTNFYVLFHDVRPILGFYLRDMLLIKESIDGTASAVAVESAVDDAEKVTVEVILKEFLFWVVSYLISVCAWIVFVHFTEITHLGKRISPRELLSRAAGSLRSTLFTCLLASLLILLYMATLAVPLVMLVHALRRSETLLRLTLVVLAIPGLLSVLYLSFLADLARVVSVLEGCCGPAAFVRAWGILKERRVQGFLLTFVLLAAAFAALEPLQLAGDVEREKGKLALMVWMEYAKVVVMVTLTAFSMAAFTVFYLDCKRCHGERSATAGVELQFDKLIDDEIPV